MAAREAVWRGATARWGRAAVVVVGMWVALVPADASAARIRGVADPCTGACVFSLCIASHGRLVPCTDPCSFDLRATLQANATPRRKRRTMIRVPDPRNPRPRARRLSALLMCVRLPRACSPCRSDADCDDGNPQTRDQCHPSPGNCDHVCG